jgi:hypothetical protein
MKIIYILSVMFVMGVFSMVLPSAYATTGEITLDQREFTLYRGNMITFPVIIEMNDYTHRPTLEIMFNGTVTQKISLYPIGDTFSSLVGLNENWESGDYTINLKYQGAILDSESFVILRDNEVVSEIITHENIHKPVEPFISLSTNELVLENSFHEIIYITGNLYSSQFGHFVIIDVTKPDGTIDTFHASHSDDGTFSGFIPIDKHWIGGEYLVSASYLNESVTESFNIQNNWGTPIFTESQLVGSFEISSSISHDYTILEIVGTIETDEQQVTLSISKGDVVMYEDTVSLNDGSFETSMVLYDYTTNTPWEYGEYSIHGMIGEKSFHSKTFTLNEQSFSVSQIQSMNLFMKMTGEMQKMVDISEIEINAKETKQVILSGTLENYISENPVEVHLISPDGIDSQSILIASSDGAYYTPIIITDTWISGVYTAYVTYGDFMDEPSTFSVINNAIIDDENVTSDDTISDVTPVEIKNYEVSFSDTKNTTSVHYTAQMESFSGKTPIILSLNGDALSDYRVTHSTDTGFIDYYLLLDYTWSPGKYTVSYVENNITIPFGTFEILGNVTDELIEIQHTSVSPVPLFLDETLFKVTTRFVDTLSFSGVVDYVGDVTVKIDDKIISHTTSDSDGAYDGILYISDNLGVGFHNVSITYGGITESAEFLIATNESISLQEDVIVFRNKIVESGGMMNISSSGIVPDFVASEIQPVFIEITGVDSQEISILPKGIGNYSYNFAISDELGDYEVSVNYAGNTIENYSISVVPAELSWVKLHTQSLINGQMNCASYLSKAVLMLEEPYTVNSDVSCPEWFADSTVMWVNDTMSDDSFYDAVLFLADETLQ